MFGIGAAEFILIIIIALIVFGPERLPELARQVGAMVRTARHMYANLRAEMGPEFDDIERGVRELRALDPRQQVRDYSRSLLDDVSRDVPEIKQVSSQPKVDLNQAARDLLNDDVLDSPINKTAIQPSSNGHATPPASKSADNTASPFE